jgi:hypothetical protein
MKRFWILDFGFWIFKPGQRSPQRPPARFMLCLIVLTALGFELGCNGKQPVTPPAPLETPTYQRLAAVHNERAARLQTFYANGVIELRWRDDKGKHFEQGNLELWIEQPRRTALRVEKVGKVFLWLGSDDDRYWLFDLLTDDSVVHTGRHDHVDGLANSALAVSPLALLDLMGVAMIPSEDDDAVVEHSAEYDAWMVRTVGSGGPVRLYLHRQSHVVIRVESLDASGNIALSSMLRRYESVSQVGMSVLAFPKLAELVDISIAEPALGAADGAAPNSGPAAFTGEVKIAIDRATGVVDDATLGRVFDLDRLMAALRPNRVEER